MSDTRALQNRLRPIPSPAGGPSSSGRDASVDLTAIVRALKERGIRAALAMHPKASGLTRSQEQRIGEIVARSWKRDAKTRAGLLNELVGLASEARMVRSQIELLDQLQGPVKGVSRLVLVQHLQATERPSEGYATCEDPVGMVRHARTNLAADLQRYAPRLREGIVEATASVIRLWAGTVVPPKNTVAVARLIVNAGGPNSIGGAMVLAMLVGETRRFTKVSTAMQHVGKLIDIGDLTTGSVSNLAHMGNSHRALTAGGVASMANLVFSILGGLVTLDKIGRASIDNARASRIAAPLQARVDVLRHLQRTQGRMGDPRPLRDERSISKNVAYGRLFGNRAHVAVLATPEYLRAYDGECRRLFDMLTSVETPVRAGVAETYRQGSELIWGVGTWEGILDRLRQHAGLRR